MEKEKRKDWQGKFGLSRQETPNSVGGAKGYETSGGEDDDDPHR